MRRLLTSPSVAVSIAIGLAVFLYGLNRGIFIGTERYVTGRECCPDWDVLQKRCRYLFVTGVSEIDAQDGRVSAPHARTDIKAQENAASKPDNGYCSIFAPPISN